MTIPRSGKLEDVESLDDSVSSRASDDEQTHRNVGAGQDDAQRERNRAIVAKDLDGRPVDQDLQRDRPIDQQLSGAGPPLAGERRGGNVIGHRHAEDRQAHL